MTLQWSATTTGGYNPESNPISFAVEKDLGGGSNIRVIGSFNFDWEGDTPTDADMLAAAGIIRDAFEAAGWTAQLDFTQSTGAGRTVEDV